MEDTFRFVIAGTGNIATSYLQAVSNIPGVEITGCVSRSGKRPRGADESLETAHSFREITSEFDGVILAVPNGMHRQYAVEAATLGKHILSEKCLEISIEAMDEMINACEKNNVKLGVTFQKRMYPDNRLVKSLLDNGKLGRVFSVELDIKCYRDQAYYDSAPYRGGYAIDGGGPFMQQGVHDVDLLAWFFGRPTQCVSMLDTFLHDIEVEDHGVALLRYPNGMIASITASTCTWPGFPPEMHIHTDKGCLTLKNDRIVEWNFKDIPRPETAEDIEIHNTASSHKVKQTAGHEAIISDFVAAVREDRDPEISGRRARLTTEIILDIYRNKL